MPRAHGFITDAIGSPIPNAELYFYRVEAHSEILHSVLIDKTGRPVSGPPAYARRAVAEHREDLTIITAGTVPDPARKGYFDVPGGLPAGSYWVDVHLDGQQRWAWPLTVTTTEQDPARIRVGGPGAGIPGGNPGGDPSRHFLAGTFTPAVSYYAMLSAPLERIQRDLARFRGAGLLNARVWIDWDYFGVTGARAFDRKGDFVESVAAKLDAVLAWLPSQGMSLDLTMHAAGYDATPKGKEGYDITEHKRALRNLLTRWGRHPSVRIVDVANEAEARGQGGHGSPDTGHVSPGRFNELMTVARSVPHTCLVGCSISPGGDYEDVVKNYQAIFRDTKGEILLPHVKRKAGWGKACGQLTRDLQKAFPGMVVHHQEPARNGHDTTPPGGWPLSEFQDSFQSSQQTGSVGCCFHGDFGFDLRQKDAFDQMDGTEQSVIRDLKSWIA